jgi:hypothetical protein
MSKKIPHRSLSSNEESVQSSFLHIPSDLFNDFSLSLEEERILAIIRSYGGSCYWSVERFAKYCRCSVRQTLRAIQKLEKSGRIQKKNRGSLSNLYSEIPLTCQTGMMTNWHDDKLAYSTCQTVTMNMTNCHNQHDSLSPYIDKDNKTDKDNYNTSIVADAPLPTEPLLKDSLTDLDSVKEPLETLEEPETSGGTHPPQFREPPLPEPHRFLAAELSAEHRAKLLAQIKSPAQRAGLDPEKLLNEQLAACEQWSHKDNKKDKFRDCWLATLQRQWIGKKIKELAENPKKPAGPSGLTYPQVETIFRDFWNEAHGLSRLDCSFVSKDQEPFIEKTFKTFAKNENDFLEFLRKQDPHQFNKQWIQIWMQFKQIESEATK